MKKIVLMMAALLSIAAHAQENCYLTAYFHTPMFYLHRPSQTIGVAAGTVGQCVDAAFEQKLFDLTRELEGPPGHLSVKTVKSIHFAYRAENGNVIQGDLERPSDN